MKSLFPLSKIKLIIIAALGAVISIAIKNHTFGNDNIADAKSKKSESGEKMTQSISESQKKSEQEKLVKKFDDCCSSLTKFQITADKALKLNNDNKNRKKKIIYIDVREDNEQDVSMLPNSVKSSDVNMSKLDPNATYVVYCTIGYRSGKFVNKLRNKGLDAYNLVGGIYGWTFEDGKIVDSKGQQTKNVHVYSDDWNFLRSDYNAQK